MSWFDTLKNVAKAVVTNALAPTPSTIAGVSSFSSAVPTNHPGFWSSLNDGASSSESDAVNVTDDSESDDGQAGTSQSTASSASVTTSSRFTYELDRFQKNALLMFVQIRSDPPTGSRVEETTNYDINVILDTFTGFRFEVTTHIDLTCSEIENTCQEFFQQNFREYGAIIVVVLTFDGITEQLAARDGRFSESIILRHLTDDLNPTLLEKPKIYITEANRTVPSESRLSLPLEEHQDVLGLHLPTIDHGTMARRPLLLLCDNINQMADTNDFVAILEKSVENMTEAASVFQDRPIEFSHNFTKEMMLAKS